MKELLDRLDKHLDSRVRLALMAMLAADEWIDFTAFREALALSDGNLASHLRKLEEVKYVELRKGFVGRKTQTSYRATALGRRAFAGHVEVLGQMLNPGGPPGDAN